MVKIHGKSIWNSCSKLPFDSVTGPMLVKIGKEVISIMESNDKSLLPEMKSVFDVILNIIIAFSTHHWALHEGFEMATSLLKFIFRQILYPANSFENVQSHGIETLKTICRARSEFLSILLVWVQTEFSHLYIPNVFKLFENLDYSQFYAQSNDIVLLINFIKTDDSYTRAVLAMKILERLFWGYAEQGEPLIARHLHRKLAIELINLHLDRMTQPDGSSVLKTVASVTMDTLGLGSSNGYDFETWLWYFYN
jgi:hypothetical protein